MHHLLQHRQKGETKGPVGSQEEEVQPSLSPGGLLRIQVGALAKSLTALHQNAIQTLEDSGF